MHHDVFPRGPMQSRDPPKIIGPFPRYGNGTHTVLTSGMLSFPLHVSSSVRLPVPRALLTSLLRGLNLVRRLFDLYTASVILTHQQRSRIGKARILSALYRPLGYQQPH